ncbi:MAG: CDP-2,3-bis-(O-geranylgeranyl)-sn-glycerol synthase [Candidatus Micrarchaeales archaeon]|jgi:CDP-2,3-bis-(O-geranylgeranyl)-sn-glycerol synthase
MPTDLLYTLIIYPIIFILPSWVANGAPVIFGGGTPLDFDKKFMKKPIFGKHKTIRGTVSGLCAGFLIAFAEYPFLSYMLLTGIMLSIGTILGDLLGSFIKRRLSIKEGASVLLMDQYLFFVFALVFASPFDKLPIPPGIVVLIVLTGVLHRLTNMLAHKAKIKKVPW